MSSAAAVATVEETTGKTDACDVRPPIFVWVPSDLRVFATADAAQRYVEPYDVDEYEVYDAEARKLHFETVGDWGFMKEPDVFLVASEDAPTHQEQLRRVLVAALGHSAPGSELPQLVRQAALRFGS